MASLLNATNLLNLAMSVIPPQIIQYIKFKSSTVNDYGELVCVYENPENVKAVIIEDSMSVYEQFGLSLQKDNRTIYVNKLIKATHNQKASDRFFFDGSYWNVIATTDWHGYNGWSSCVVSRVVEEEVPNGE